MGKMTTSQVLLKWAVLPDQDSFLSHDGPFELGLRQRQTQRGEQPLTRHPEDVLPWLARRRLEIETGSPIELENFQLLVDDDARRDVAGNEQALDVLRHVETRPQESRRAAVGRLLGARLDFQSGRKPDRAVGSRAREDLGGLVHDGEELAEPRYAFAVPEEEEPRLVQGVVNAGEDSLLKRFAEVDQDVATAHQIHLREGRIAREIVPDEDAQLAHVLLDAIAAVELGEVAPPPLLAQVPYRAIGEDAGARLLDAPLTEVRTEDLDCVRAGGIPQELEQGDGERIDLFAGGATRRPEPNRGAFRF